MKRAWYVAVKYKAGKLIPVELIALQPQATHSEALDVVRRKNGANVFALYVDVSLQPPDDEMISAAVKAEDPPMVEIVDRNTGHRWAIYTNGRYEGFPEGAYIVNRIPLLVRQAARSGAVSLNLRSRAA